MTVGTKIIKCYGIGVKFVNSGATHSLVKYQIIRKLMGNLSFLQVINSQCKR